MSSQGPRLQFPAVAIFCAVLFLGPVASAVAQASLLDASFHFDSSFNDRAVSVLPLDDGRILLGGTFAHNGGTGLLRLNADGGIDQSFTGQTGEGVYRMVRQPDGRVLVAGALQMLRGIPCNRLGRLLPGGEVDTSFLAPSLLVAGHTVMALALQGDGKILIGTETQTAQGLMRGGLFRLHPDGQIDDAFVQTNRFDGYYIFSIVPRDDGAILVGGGFQGVNGFPSPALALVSTNGELDTNFVASVRMNAGSGIYAMAEQPDESVVLGGGFWREGLTNRMLLAKLTSGLDWDPGFQPDIFDPTPGIYYGGAPHVMTMALQADGKLLIGGKFQEVGGYWRQCLARLDADGHVDPCFDPGLGLLPRQPMMLGAQSIALEPDGKVLVAGDFHNPTSLSHLVTRFLPQSECGAIRVHVSPFNFVAGTSSPGGTNYLQWSTNLVEWSTAMVSPGPYVYSSVPYTLYDQMFFRVKKAY